MRELIDILFWYSGFGLWSIVVCFIVYKIHRLFINNKIGWYILIKNLIEFPFVMFYLRCWGENSLQNAHNHIAELKKDIIEYSKIYWLTRVGFDYVEYRYNRKNIK
jgi:hypothetical protein